MRRIFMRTSEHQAPLFLTGLYSSQIPRIHTRRLLFLLLLPVGALLYFLTAHTPFFIEQAYSTRFSKWIRQGLSLTAGLFPISLGEIVLILFALLILAWITYTVVAIFRRKQFKGRIAANFLINAAVLVSLIYFVIILIWNLNYNRPPFATLAGLDVHPSSIQELQQVCENLIGKANELRAKIPEDSRGIMSLPSGTKNVFSRASLGYQQASAVYPELGGNYGRPKGVLFSKFLSSAGLSGIYFPFTAEPNINIDMPAMLIPSTACHEMAHQRGFAREDEANYIGYLTCKLHPDADFQYSGVMLAAINAMNALYAQDPDLYRSLRDKYSDAVKRDLTDDSRYWQSFEGPVEKISNKLNDVYLKANRQEDGVKSYGRMVDLLLAEYRSGQQPSP